MRGKFTEKKQNDLYRIFETIICAGNLILDKYPKWSDESFWIFDLNAGPGIYKDGLEGSPILLLKVLSRFTERPCKLFLFENDRDSKKFGSSIYESLCQNLKKFRIPNRIKINLLYGDQQEKLPLFYQNTRLKRFGLCYQDFSGSPDFRILSEFSHVACYSKTDILINCNTSAIKRNKGLNRNPNYNVCKETRLPLDAIKDIDKQYWQIRQPLGNWQWQMLLGTNWPAFPKFKGLGFEPI